MCLAIAKIFQRLFLRCRPTPIFVAICVSAPWSCWAIPLTTFPGIGDFKTPFVPDFYQHQKAGNDANKDPLDFDDAFRSAPPGGPAPRPANPPGVPSYDTTTNWWEGGFGWCCTTALVDSFYFLEKAYGIIGLFSRPDKEAAFMAANGRAPTWQEDDLCHRG